MAETLTYQNDTDTVTTEDNLTAEEQESLKVGEELAEQESQLLAGKYKDAEELERAYVELQKKLGDKGTENSEEVGDTKSSDSETDQEEEEKTEENSEAVTLINEAAAEYWDNEQSLSEETIGKLSGMDSKELLSAYLEVQKNAAAPQETEVPDLNESEVNSVRNSVGGEAEYNKIVSWASENLSQEDIQSFDALVSTGNVGAIKLAVNGLKAQYENTNGYEGTMVSGKAPRSGEVFRSQQELVRAMNDPRYDNDPAYRQDVIEKLDRSNNLEF